MRVMLVTKPLAPPWNDSGKVVPRDLVRAASGRHDLHVLVPPGGEAGWRKPVCAHPVYRDPGSFRPRGLQQVRLLAGVWRLRGQVDALHFFFQPHPPAVRAARALTFACGLPSVHTVLSAPREDTDAARLGFGDRTVCLSQHTASRFPERGGRTTAVIPPALADLEAAGSDRAQAARGEASLEEAFVIYPGDYEYSGGHDLLLEVWSESRDLPMLVFAGRPKTAAAEERRRALEALAVVRGLAGRVRFLGAVDDMPGLLAASEAVLFPAASLYAKTDLPLVVLEAWRESRPVLVSDLAPLTEAVGGAGAVLPLESHAWVEAVRALASRGPEWGTAGCARLHERHTATRAARCYEAIYDELEAGDRPAGGSAR